MHRATGERVLFALAQIQVEEMEAVESKFSLSKRRPATRAAWVAIDKARSTSFESHTGRPLLPWSLPHKAQRFFTARTDTAFQAFMLAVGINRGKISPDLRKAARSASAIARRRGVDILDFDLIPAQR